MTFHKKNCRQCLNFILNTTNFTTSISRIHLLENRIIKQFLMYMYTLQIILLCFKIKTMQIFIKLFCTTLLQWFLWKDTLKVWRYFIHQLVYPFNDYFKWALLITYPTTKISVSNEYNLHQSSISVTQSKYSSNLLRNVAFLLSNDEKFIIS